MTLKNSIRGFRAIRTGSGIFHGIPRQIISSRGSQIRCYSSDIEELKTEDSLESDNSTSSTGVIDVEKQKEVVLYYDHMFPLTLSKFGAQIKKIGSLFGVSHDEKELKQRVLTLSDSKANPLPTNLKITEMIPVRRDGGAFVKYEIPEGFEPKELIKQIDANVKANKAGLGTWETIKHTLLNNYPKCFQVKGTPWIEDLQRFPSSRLKIKFEGEALSEEELYFLFRRYGPIVDIIPLSASQPYATIIFRRIRSAIAAKNCITGLKVNQSKSSLHIQYISVKRANYLANFIMEHQRISIPIIFALLAAVAVMIFDPIRQWFIEQKVTHKYSFDTYKDTTVVKLFYTPYKMAKNWVSQSYDFIDEKISKCDQDVKDLIENDDPDTKIDRSDDIWTERAEKAKQLKLWIYENINTFIIVKGPKGSGKSEFVIDNTIQNDPVLRKQVLYIDCESIVKARTDNEMLRRLGNQLGYFPLFTWTNSISSFVDLAVQGITGQKSGISESIEQQIKNMFSLTNLALRNVALKDYDAYKNAVIRQKRKLEKTKESNAKSGEELIVDDSLLKEDQFLQQHPEYKPIIVINKFARKSDSPHDFVYKMIADWAAQAVQSNVANVIFITHDMGSVPLLADALPNQVFKTISLSDATKRSSIQYIHSQLNRSTIDKLGTLEKCLEPLGGRMLDLQSFVRRIKSGEDPDEALNEMIKQAAEQITTFFLNKSVESSLDANLSSAQVWIVMKLLTENEKVPFSKIIKSPLLKPSIETLETLSILEKHDIISITRDKGIISHISTGRPLYRAAFKTLVEDPNILELYDSNYYNTLIKLETNKIAKLEDELTKYKDIPASNLPKNRIEYLQSKISTSSDTIKSYEETIKALSKKKSEPSWAQKIVGVK